MTGKVEQLPFRVRLESDLSVSKSKRTKKTEKLSEMCLKLGQNYSGLAFTKIFRKPSEAYQDWNAN